MTDVEMPIQLVTHEPKYDKEQTSTIFFKSGRLEDLIFIASRCNIICCELGEESIIQTHPSSPFTLLFVIEDDGFNGDGFVWKRTDIVIKRGSNAVTIGELEELCDFYTENPHGILDHCLRLETELPAALIGEKDLTKIPALDSTTLVLQNVIPVAFELPFSEQYMKKAVSYYLERNPYNNGSNCRKIEEGLFSKENNIAQGTWKYINNATGQLVYSVTKTVKFNRDIFAISDQEPEEGGSQSRESKRDDNYVENVTFEINDHSGLLGNSEKLVIDQDGIIQSGLRNRTMNVNKEKEQRKFQTHGWKIATKLHGEHCMIKLLIPSDATIISAEANKKCRTSEAYVLSIIPIEFIKEKVTSKPVSLGKQEVDDKNQSKEENEEENDDYSKELKPSWLEKFSNLLPDDFFDAKVTKAKYNWEDEQEIAYSIYQPSFVYKKDEFVKPETFDKSFKCCSGGIHFFNTQSDAIEYALNHYISNTNIIGYEKMEKL